MFFDKFHITNRDGHRLACLLYLPSERPFFQLIVSHGFRGAKENSGRLEVFASKVVNQGGSLLAFDFAGSGESEGQFVDMSLTRQVENLEDVSEYSLARDNSPLVLLGRSFGGSTSLIKAAMDGRVRGLVLWSTPVLLQQTFFVHAPQQLERMLQGESLKFEDDKGGFLLGPEFGYDIEKHDFSTYLKKMSECPTLVIHGEKDLDVDLRNVELIKKHAGSNFRIHVVPGADHRFTEHLQIREDLTLRWLDENFGDSKR